MKDKSRTKDEYTQYVLKLALLFYLAHLYWDIFKLIHFQVFVIWEVGLKAALSLVFGGFGLLIFTLKTRKFKVFGFLIVFISSLLEIVWALSVKGFDFELISIYFLLFSVALYQLLRLEHNHSSHRH